MPHEMPLLATIAGALLSAWSLGIVARKFGLSPIVGYLLAGIVIGPHTPGFVGDPALAAELAEIGVVLLMFGVGLHFHPKDLLAAKDIALPGALVQGACATVLGLVLARGFGWTWSAGLVLGLALAVASTVVLLRALEDRELLATAPGHVALGWLIVEDVLTVAVLVVLPAVGTSGGSSRGPLPALLLALAKLAVLVALVLLAGKHLVPWLLEQAARLRSRDLFTLTVRPGATA